MNFQNMFYNHRKKLTIFIFFCNPKNELKFLEGGNATGVRQSSMLGFAGERVCRRSHQICSVSETQQAPFLSYQCIWGMVF